MKKFEVAEYSAAILSLWPPLALDSRALLHFLLFSLLDFFEIGIRLMQIEVADAF